MDSTPHEPYPPAPWRLRGHSIQALRLIDSSIARDHVPAGLRVVTVWPGKTLAVLYCASYEPPSVLRYHELVLAPALVAAGGRIGFWISRIYVDDAISQAGGRGIWGLPKELASFTWQPDNREVAVHIGEQPLCRFRLSSGRPSANGRLTAWARPAAPMPLYLPVITQGAAGFLFFSGRGSVTVARVSGEVLIESGSPLAGLGFDGTRNLIAARRLRLQVAAPGA